MGYWVVLGLGWLAGRVPRRLRLAVSGALGVLVYLCWPAKRRITIANMAQVLGTSSRDQRARDLARRSWRNYGRYTSEFFYLPNTTVAAVMARLKDMTPAPGWQARLDEATSAGRGVLVPTAHFGNWDAAGVAVGSRVPLHAIAETFPDARLNELVQRQRSALGMTIIPMERTPRRIMRVLQEGGTVATPVDRPLAAGEGVPVTFFGRRCYVPGGIAQLALKTGSAIACGFVWYDEAYSPTYYAFLAPPIFPEATGDKAGDVIALTQRIYTIIEDIVRQHPAQWYMFRPFWPDAPDAPDEPRRQGSPEAAGAADRARATDIGEAPHGEGAGHVSA